MKNTTTSGHWASKRSLELGATEVEGEVEGEGEKKYHGNRHLNSMPVHTNTPVSVAISVPECSSDGGRPRASSTAVAYLQWWEGHTYAQATLYTTGTRHTQ